MQLRSVASLPALLLGAALVGSHPPPLEAQVDEGTLVIYAGARRVGAEQFQAGPDGGGTKLTSKVSYLRAPQLSLELSVVYHDRESAFQSDRRCGGSPRQVYAVQQRNRVTIRRIDAGGEQASELPGSPDLVLLADSAFSPYLRLIPLAAGGPRTLKGLFPESGRRVSFQVERRAAASGSGIQIRLLGDLEGEILLGADDEVLRISLPALGLEARRESR